MTPAPATPSAADPTALGTGTGPGSSPDAAGTHPSPAPAGRAAWPWMLCALALGVRALAVALSQCISSDGPIYVEVARRYAEGDWAGGLGHTYHPLYPALMALAHGLIDDWERAGQGVSVLISALGTLPLYFLARRLWDDRIAAAAAFLYAVSPYPVRLSAEVLTTGPYFGLTLLALWAAVEAWTTRRVAWYALAGAAAGLAYLCRVDGIVLAAGLLGWSVVLAPGEWRAAPARRAAAIGAFALALALVAGPYLAYLRVDSGGWTLSRKTDAATFTLNLNATELPPEVGGAPREPKGSGDGKEDGSGKAPDDGGGGKAGDPVLPRVTERRGGHETVLGKWLAAVARVFVETAEASPWALVLFMWFGMAATAVRRPRDWREIAVLSVPLAFLAALLVFSATHYRESKRYAAPIAVWLLPWAAVGLSVTGGWLAARLRFLRDGTTALVVLLLVFGVSYAGKTFKPNGGDKRGEREAGLWIRAHARAPAPAVCSSVHRVVYYAQARPVWLFGNVTHTPDSIRAMLRTSGAEYLVVDRHIERTCPGFFAWVADPARSGLRLVFGSAKTIESGTAKDEVRVYAAE